MTKFDRIALRLLSWDLSKNPSNCEDVKNLKCILSQKEAVYDAFNRWRNHTQSVAGNNTHSEVLIEEKLEYGSKSIASCSTVNRDLTRTKGKHKKRSFKGTSILPSTRRKRNKVLVYDTK